MIKSLEIKNFALVESLSVEFGPGLNVLTGETGAGKTIIVNAIAQLFGERSSADLVRSGARKAIIEARLHAPLTPELKQMAAEFELDMDDTGSLIIRKEIGANGGTRNFVNDSPVTLNRLTRLGSALLDLHGQHQHQRLLHAENHLAYLDAYGGLEQDAENLRSVFLAYKNESQALQSLKERQLKAYQKQDMYRFQLGELNKAKLEAGEVQQLKNELRILSNVEILHRLAGDLSEKLYSGENNAAQLLAQSEDSLKELSGLDEQFVSFIQSISAARESIEEIGRFAESYISGLQFDAQRMEFIHQRMAQLDFLIRKYQVASVEDLIALQQRIEGELSDSEQFDEEIQKKEKIVGALHDQTAALAGELSQKRRQAAADFCQRITTLLADVGMPRARFRVKQELKKKESGEFAVQGQPVAMDEKGFDQVVFEIAPNGGEGFKPLHKVASGGELSRIMLALKSVLAQKDHIPSLVFDEIDAGISGKVAQIVGQKIAGLSRYHQILCVTHLPQIAAFADKHYKVSKTTEDSRTFVDIVLLDQQKTIQEIANLLAGRQVSPQALENASHLIKEAKTLRE